MENIMLTIVIFLLLFILGDNISKISTNTKDKEAIVDSILALIGIIINILILLGRYNYIKI